MVQMNGKEITTSDAMMIMAAPEDVDDRGENMELGNDKAMEIIKRVLPELLERVEKLEVKVNGTENREDDAELLLAEEDAATSYLLAGETEEESVDRLLGNPHPRRDSFDDGADQLLAFNKKRLSDG